MACVLSSERDGCYGAHLQSQNFYTELPGEDRGITLKFMGQIHRNRKHGRNKRSLFHKQAQKLSLDLHMCTVAHMYLHLHTYIKQNTHRETHTDIITIFRLLRSIHQYIDSD